MLNQKLQLKLSQKLSPQQIQLMKLIQMTTAGLEQKVKNEIEENPALEHGSELSELIEDDSKEFDLDVHNEDINVDDYLTDDNNDYNQNFYTTNELYNLGFGFVVGGTITLEPRLGNGKPRVIRDLDNSHNL